MFNKRGISNIIATLLLVLLAIVIIGVVWVIVRNLVSSSSQGISLGGLTLNLKIEQAVKGGNNLSVTVQRQPGAGNLVGVNFVVSDGSIYEAIKQNTSLGIYEGNSFTLFPKQVNISLAKTVSVAPIYISENGGIQQTGSITDTYTFGNSSISGTGSSGGNGGGNGGNNGGGNGGGNGGSNSCGDGICNNGDTCSTCPTDCGICGNSGGYCGDGICNNGETCSTCPTDCGICGVSCNITNCFKSSYQCGFPPDGCGGNLTCGNDDGLCNTPNSFCTNNSNTNPFQCEPYQDVNNGTIFSVWPSQAVIFFDSSNLTDPSSYTWNDGQHYVRFLGSHELGCIQVALVTPEPFPSTISYMSLGSVANISA
jgi:flagellin-like protein